MADVNNKSEKVISLASLMNDRRFPAQGLLYSYWQSLRGTRLVPARSEVDPRAIEDCLEYAFILERIAPGLGFQTGPRQRSSKCRGKR